MVKIRKSIGVFTYDVGNIMVKDDNNFLEYVVKEVKRGYKRELYRKAVKIVGKEKIEDIKEIGNLKLKDENVDCLIKVFEIRLTDKVEVQGYKWLHLSKYNELLMQSEIEDLITSASYLTYLSK